MGYQLKFRKTTTATPGRYVGYSIQVDEDFEYQKRLNEIRSELLELNADANGLMELIQCIAI